MSFAPPKRSTSKSGRYAASSASDRNHHVRGAMPATPRTPRGLSNNAVNGNYAASSATSSPQRDDAQVAVPAAGRRGREMSSSPRAVSAGSSESRGGNRGGGNSSSDGGGGGYADRYARRHSQSYERIAKASREKILHQMEQQHEASQPFDPNGTDYNHDKFYFYKLSALNNAIDRERRMATPQQQRRKSKPTSITTPLQTPRGTTSASPPTSSSRGRREVSPSGRSDMFPDRGYDRGERRSSVSPSSAAAMGDGDGYYNGESSRPQLQRRGRSPSSVSTAGPPPSAASTQRQRGTLSPSRHEITDAVADEAFGAYYYRYQHDACTRGDGSPLSVPRRHHQSSSSLTVDDRVAEAEVVRHLERIFFADRQAQANRSDGEGSMHGLGVGGAMRYSDIRSVLNAVGLNHTPRAGARGDDADDDDDGFGDEVWLDLQETQARLAREKEESRGGYDYYDNNAPFSSGSAPFGNGATPPDTHQRRRLQGRENGGGATKNDNNNKAAPTRNDAQQQQQHHSQQFAAYIADVEAFVEVLVRHGAVRMARSALTKAMVKASADRLQAPTATTAALIGSARRNQRQTHSNQQTAPHQIEGDGHGRRVHSFPQRGEAGGRTRCTEEKGDGEEDAYVAVSDYDDDEDYHYYNNNDDANGQYSGGRRGSSERDDVVRSMSVEELAAMRPKGYVVSPTSKAREEKGRRRGQQQRWGEEHSPSSSSSNHIGGSTSNGNSSASQPLTATTGTTTPPPQSVAAAAAVNSNNSNSNTSNATTPSRPTPLTPSHEHMNNSTNTNAQQSTSDAANAPPPPTSPSIPMLGLPPKSPRSRGGGGHHAIKSPSSSSNQHGSGPTFDEGGAPVVRRIIAAPAAASKRTPTAFDNERDGDYVDGIGGSGVHRRLNMQPPSRQNREYDDDGIASSPSDVSNDDDAMVSSGDDGEDALGWEGQGRGGRERSASPSLSPLSTRSRQQIEPYYGYGSNGADLDGNEAQQTSVSPSREPRGNGRAEDQQPQQQQREQPRVLSQRYSDEGGGRGGGAGRSLLDADAKSDNSQQNTVNPTRSANLAEGIHSSSAGEATSKHITRRIVSHKHREPQQQNKEAAPSALQQLQPSTPDRRRGANSNNAYVDPMSVVLSPLSPPAKKAAAAAKMKAASPNSPWLDLRKGGRLRRSSPLKTVGGAVASSPVGRSSRYAALGEPAKRERKGEGAFVNPDADAFRRLYERSLFRQALQKKREALAMVPRRGGGATNTITPYSHRSNSPTPSSTPSYSQRKRGPACAEEDVNTNYYRGHIVHDDTANREGDADGDDALCCEGGTNHTRYYREAFDMMSRGMQDAERDRVAKAAAEARACTFTPRINASSHRFASSMATTPNRNTTHAADGRRNASSPVSTPNTSVLHHSGAMVSIARNSKLRSNPSNSQVAINASSSSNTTAVNKNGQLVTVPPQHLVVSARLYQPTQSRLNTIEADMRSKAVEEAKLKEALSHCTFEPTIRSNPTPFPSDHVPPLYVETVSRLRYGAMERSRRPPKFSDHGYLRGDHPNDPKDMKVIDAQRREAKARRAQRAAEKERLRKEREERRMRCGESAVDDGDNSDSDDDNSTCSSQQLGSSDEDERLKHPRYSDSDPEYWEQKPVLRLRAGDGTIHDICVTRTNSVGKSMASRSSSVTRTDI